MGYIEALSAAGAEVHAEEYFGSYQGDWWALVTYEGKQGWVHGSFGSCSYCDAFQSEFSYYDDDKPEYQQRLANFGRGYLDYLYSQEEAEKQAEENSAWDMDSHQALAFLKRHDYTRLN